MRCSRGARGRQASCGLNAAKPGFSPGKLMYDHKKRSCGTGQTISTILKHEFRKKDQDGMGKERGTVDRIETKVGGRPRQRDKKGGQTG